MDIIKISLLGVCGVMLGFLMKGTRPEYACFITVGVGLVIMGLAVGKIRYLFESLEEIQKTVPVNTQVYFHTGENGRNHLYWTICIWNMQRCRLQYNSGADRTVLQTIGNGA